MITISEYTTEDYKQLIGLVSSYVSVYPFYVFAKNITVSLIKFDGVLVGDHTYPVFNSAMREQHGLKRIIELLNEDA